MNIDEYGSIPIEVSNHDAAVRYYENRLGEEGMHKHREIWNGSYISPMSKPSAEVRRLVDTSRVIKIPGFYEEFLRAPDAPRSWMRIAWWNCNDEDLLAFIQASRMCGHNVHLFSTAIELAMNESSLHYDEMEMYGDSVTKSHYRSVSLRDDSNVHEIRIATIRLLENHYSSQLVKEVCDRVISEDTTANGLEIIGLLDNWEEAKRHPISWTMRIYSQDTSPCDFKHDDWYYG